MRSRVGSESWALLRALSHGTGLRIARPREPGLEFAPAPLHTGAELGTLPSWWSAAARTGLCLSDPISSTEGHRGAQRETRRERHPHHPGLLSRASLQGVPAPYTRHAKYTLSTIADNYSVNFSLKHSESLLGFRTISKWVQFSLRNLWKRIVSILFSYPFFIQTLHFCIQRSRYATMTPLGCQRR